MVKADGYGHGLVPVGPGRRWPAARAGSGSRCWRRRWRCARPASPSPCWPGCGRRRRPRRCARALAAGVDISVSSADRRCELVVAAAAELGSRPGCTSRSTPACPATAPPPPTGPTWSPPRRRPQRPAWSRWSASGATSSAPTRPGHPTTAAQIERFGEALRRRRTAPACVPQVRHLANSAATVTLPEAHFDLVRPGIAVYGLSPVPERGDFGLVPAMTLRSRAGAGQAGAGRRGCLLRPPVLTERDTTLALVPLGYADGMPRSGHQRRAGVDQRPRGSRSAAGSAWTSSWSTSATTRPPSRRRGRAVRPGHDGEPTAQDWADALGTIHYEIVTRIGARVPRTLPRRRAGSAVRRGAGVIGGAVGRASVAAAVAGVGLAAPAVGPARVARIDRSSAEQFACASRSTAAAGCSADDGVGLYDEEVGPVDAPLTVRLRARLTACNLGVVPLPAPRTWRRASATGSGWCSTTSAATAARAESTPRHCTDRAARPRPVQRDRRSSRRPGRSCWSGTRWAA